MKFTRSQKMIFAAGGFILVGVLSLTAYVSYALYKVNVESTGDMPGTIGLRSYFHCGDGTQSDPFVITRPIHFRNLGRLQNLGAFDKTNPNAQTSDNTLSNYDTDSLYHFQLGYELDSVNHAGELLVYDYNDDGTVVADSYTTTLNMKMYQSLSEPILSIGSEGTPFYGVFDGSGLTIENLSVQSGPEDVGVFGYTYSGSTVKNVFFKTLNVNDDGWAYTSTTGPAGLKELATCTETGSISYVYGESGSETTDQITTSTKSFSDITGKFTASFPTISGCNATYEFRSSSEFLTSTSNGELSISSTALDGLITAGKLTSGSRLNTRLTIVGKMFGDGISYSRVLSSYLITFTYASSAVRFEITQDTLAGTEYHHNVNIGYLIGHCDGSASQCYVYDGTITLNGNRTTNTAVSQETETGLIGEIGCALQSDFTPQTNYDAAGDTGVVDFTNMYNTIMPTAGATKDSVNSCYYFTPNDEDADTSGVQNRFYDYLRYDIYRTGDSKITSATNAVDFAGSQYIADTDTNKLGLGVFSMASTKYSKDEPKTHLGDFSITKGTSFTEFYYTTAEYYDDYNRVSYPTSGGTPIPVRGWGLYADSTTKMYMARYLPTYSDTATWTPQLEKTFNFIFRCDILNSSDYTTQLNGRNYFSNITNSFLQSYFSYKLIDKNGEAIAPGNKDFGVMLKTVDPDTSVQSPITSFDSYLTLNAPELAEDYNNNCYIPTITVDDGTADGAKYPGRSIDFGIGQEEGSTIEYANVTVVAGSQSGNGGYVSVYKLDDFSDSTWNYSSTSSSSQNTNYPNRRPFVSTYIPGSGLNSDRFAYFDTQSQYNTSTSSYELNVTDTHATLSSGGTHLFAHTFKLPKGKYFIASPNASTYLYYVAAQGQGEKGNTGSASNTFSTLNTISNVDFLSLDPTSNGFALAAARCYLSFLATWDTNAGTVHVTSTNTDGIAYSTITPSGTSPDPDNLTYILVDNESKSHSPGYVSYYVTYFGETATVNQFIERTY